MTLSRYSRSVAPLGRHAAPITSMSVIGGDGKLVIAPPLDYLPWVKPFDDFARRTDLTASERWLLVSRHVTPHVHQELSAHGWRVSDKLAAVR